VINMAKECAFCEQEVDYENEEYMSVNGTPVHHSCFEDELEQDLNDADIGIVPGSVDVE